MHLKLFCALFALLACAGVRAQKSESKAPGCRVETVAFEGWKAEEISNGRVKIVIVPQLGGRVMQVYFDGHPYLFVNPKYKGQYISPEEAAAKGQHWINYGGDKIWPLPEGTEDEHHWPGPISDALDDGNYDFKVLSQGAECKVRLDGPPDARTGLQYTREISLRGDSTEIRFHAVMKNVANHAIQWSMQSVTQYDTGDPQDAAGYNRQFWAMTPANPKSAYLGSYWVRAGLADDPSFRLDGGLFCLHWLPLENEVWLDSTAGWVVVADGGSRYAMIEKSRYDAKGEYPGKASVIFYKNGGRVQMNERGLPEMSSLQAETAPRYMEAELNSPMVSLAPGETYAMDTEWKPVRVGNVVSTTEAGACSGLMRGVKTEVTGDW
jgi:hypothetical protein